MKPFRVFLLITLGVSALVADTRIVNHSTDSRHEPARQASGLPTLPQADPASLQTTQLGLDSRERIPLDQGADWCPATIVATIPYVDSGSTAGLTWNATWTSCSNGAHGPDVIYFFDPPFPGGRHTVTTAGSDFQTHFFITVNPGGLHPCPPTGESILACRRFTGGVQPSYTGLFNYNFTYYIVVGGDQGQSGNYVLTISGPPQNDLPCSPLALTGSLPIIVTGDNTNAQDHMSLSGFGSIPPCWSGAFTVGMGQGAVANDVTYSWTIPATGQYRISTCTGSVMTPILTVYQNTCPTVPQNPGDFICGAYANCGNYSEVVTPQLAGGSPVLIVVDGWSPTANGSYTLRIESVVPPCVGSLLAGPREIAFDPTPIGTVAHRSLTINNVDATNALCVTGIGDNAWTFAGSPYSFVVPPNSFQMVDVTFHAQISGQHAEWLYIYSSDPARPVDSILCSGDGYRPLSSPQTVEIAFTRGESAAVRLPWDDNGHTTQYAIEYSSDNFATSKFLHPYGGSETMPHFVTIDLWGSLGRSSLYNLQPSTNYAVRLHAKDIANNVLIGPAANLTTTPQILVDSTRFKLVIQVIDANSAELNWDPNVLDLSGEPVDVDGFAVFADDDFLGDSQLLAVDDVPPFIVTFDNLRRLYFVRPLLPGTPGRSGAFISYPPDGARVAGEVSIFAQDGGEEESWLDAFMETEDSFGAPFVFWTLNNNRTGEAGLYGGAVNFDDLGSGPKQIRLQVTDGFGLIRRDSITVYAYPSSQADYTVTYDGVTGKVRLDTTGLVNVHGSLLAIKWLLSDHGTIHGPRAVITPPLHATDDMEEVTAIPIGDQKTITLGRKKREIDLGGYNIILPSGDISTVLHGNAVAHCEAISVNADSTQGLTGTYAAIPAPFADQAQLPLGRYVRIKDNAFRVGVGFEVCIDLKWKIVLDGIGAFWGQDCKRTTSLSTGYCPEPPDTASFVPLSLPALTHKRYAGVDYPFAGFAFGNDNYRPSSPSPFTDYGSNQRICWWDFPSESGRLTDGWGQRLERQAGFFARFSPSASNPESYCCTCWQLEWDVVFCEDNSVRELISPWLSGPLCVDTIDPCAELNGP